MALLILPKLLMMVFKQKSIIMFNHNHLQFLNFLQMMIKLRNKSPSKRKMIKKIINKRRIIRTKNLKHETDILILNTIYLI